MQYTNQVENKSHFLFQCELYNIERSRLEVAIGVPLANLNEKDKYDLLFEHPFILAKYVHKSFRKGRREKLYEPNG